MFNSEKWHCVEPKKDCPHVHEVNIEYPRNIEEKVCSICGESEVWICMTCGKILCSRYKNKHMKEHYENEKHPISCSFSDLSFWCNECESYIVDERLQPFYTHLSKDKFSSEENLFQNGSKEFVESEEECRKKVKKIAEWIKSSRYTICFTGAGISTSASIPDYRGPKGVWTMKEKGLKAEMPISLSEATPTFCHNELAKMTQKGMIQCIISTNIDGLHYRSGVSLDQLVELHGNVNKERCVQCKSLFYRSFSTTNFHLTKEEEIEKSKTYGGHFHGRTCEKCGGDLVDTIINFKETLDPKDMGIALTHSEKSECSIVLGTSMRVQPACSLPLYAKKNKGGKVVLVNLQKCPYDDMIDCRVFMKTDDFMKMLAEELYDDYGSKEEKEEKE